MSKGKPSNRAALWTRINSVRRRKMRSAIIERDGTKCFHCGRQTSEPDGSQKPDQMTIDHWPVPKRLLPREEWLNPSRAVLACLECNRRLDHQAQVGRAELSMRNA